MTKNSACPISQHGNIPQEKLESMKRQFDLLDTDEDGVISAEQLSNVLRSIELNITDKEMSQAMEKTDVDGDGIITFDDFVAAVILAKQELSIKTDHEKEMTLRKTFQVFDRQNFGVISSQDIWTVLKNLGKDFSLEEVEEMIEEIDEDGDSRITYPEFVQAVMA